MGKRTENDERFRSKMNAWLMIQVIGQTSVNFLNKKKLEKEMREHLKVFSSGEELSEFAEYFIDSCLSSRSYRTTLFGTIPMSDGGAATRLAQDMEEVTRIIPERFGLGDESKELRKALFDAYLNKIDNAEKILKEVGITLD